MENVLRDNLKEQSNPQIENLTEDRNFSHIKVQEVYQSEMDTSQSARLLFSCYSAIIDIYFLPSLLDAS